ncbi:right-handed parallel beta-helix repeat-containing protein [Oxalobacteraceae bacterium R-40]|uniref:Right-handed parallel beta-helix repeat-containing protein n=1 Tax=Keguizhuia sedimenti TaxID=3064264 RepID=A0ABU1BLL9_9BURK|nr:right-handed parallel beta-helix repeat-containing protein [Oxalobacteraceae bacterium R-40]
MKHEQNRRPKIAGLFGGAAVCFFLIAIGGSIPAWGAQRHVAPSHPNATDSGEGGAAHPYRSISYAMSRIQPGDTLYIAAGLYREAIIFPKRDWSSQKPTMVAGVGEVSILGTDIVKGWRKLERGFFIRENWTNEPQQVVLNGHLLKQFGGTIFNGYPLRKGHDMADLHRSEGGIWPRRLTGGIKSMPLHSFYYDKERQAILIRTDASSLENDMVEVAVRPYLVQGERVAGITIQNIAFRYSTTSTISRQGAVTLMGCKNVLKNITVQDADGAGIEIEGDDNEIRHSIVTRSGYLGIKARGKNVTIIANHVTFNNVRGFNKWWEAGGMKFIGGGGLRQSRVNGNEVTHNYGDGIWFDWGNERNQISRNTVAYNTGFGIHYEASSEAFIVDNRVFGNRQRGIYLPHSRNSLVARNMVLANGLEGITAIDEHRQDNEGNLDLRPRNNRIVRNIVAWNKGLAVILPGAEYGNTSDQNIYISDDGNPKFSMGWPNAGSGRKNINEWRGREKQDERSQTFKLAMSKEVRNALAHEKLGFDWSILKPYQAYVNRTYQEVDSSADLLTK